jgi:hypothetical protein
MYARNQKIFGNLVLKDWSGRGKCDFCFFKNCMRHIFTRGKQSFQKMWLHSSCSTDLGTIEPDLSLWATMLGIWANARALTLFEDRKCLDPA